MPGILLWDIDGTLITMRGGAADKHAQAFAAALDIATPANPPTAGKTDGQIMAELAADHQVTLSPELLAAMFAELTSITQRELDQQAACVAPGVQALLADAQASGWRHGLLTGNIPDRAAIKLASAQLTPYIDADLMFTGQAPSPRTELGRVVGQTLRGVDQSCIVIGDTPLDIAAARAGGFTVLSVATGNFDVPSLQVHEPDLVVRDLHQDRHLVDAFLARNSSA